MLKRSEYFQMSSDTYLGDQRKLPLTPQSAQGTLFCIFLSGVRGSHAEAKARFFKKQRQSLLWVSVAITVRITFVCPLPAE